MKLRLKLAGFLLVLLLTSLAVAQQPKAMLPEVFAGWERSGAANTGSDPAAIDPTSAKVLKEYGFTGFETASYNKSDRKLTVRAIAFQDASGAYGAFTFYRQPRMQTENIGTMAASANEEVFFFRGNVLVDAKFDRVTAMSGGELRELAAALPFGNGPSMSLPTLPNYLPREHMVTNSAKFILGPETLMAVGGPIDATQADFSRNPEVLLSKYADGPDTADVALIEYPTPQIAGDRLKIFEQAKAQQQGSTFEVKRTGPIVALVKGNVSDSTAKKILARVNYEADVTWNENTGLSKKDNIGNLVIAASLLAGIIFLFSVGFGAIVGFTRIMLHRVFPERFGPEGEENDFIRLDLRK